MTPAEERQQKIADAEYELRLFDDFLNSQVWKLLKSQWQPIVDTAIGAALSGKVDDRGFAAGKANGLRSFLQYPEKHVKKLRIDLKQLRGIDQTQTSGS